MMKKHMPILFLCLLLLLTGCAKKAPPPVTSPTELPEASPVAQVTEQPEDEPALVFTARDALGNSVNQEDWAGYNLIMLNFWATWCPPCIRELPELQLLHEAYGERGLLLLGVLTDGKTEDALPLIEQFGLSYSIFTAEGDLKQFSRSVQAVPTSFFLSPSGEELMKVVGSRDYKGWAEIVEDLLP